MKNILIIFGGKSNEYEVSLKSASSVIDNIDKSKYRIITIGITEEGKWLRFDGSTEEIRNNTWFNNKTCKEAVLSPCTSHKGFIEFDDYSTNLVSVDLVFPVLHGKFGEDGTVQGLLELSGIPFIGCKTLSSSICMDKAIAHNIVREAGIKVAKSLTIFEEDDNIVDKIKEKDMKLPLYIKPAKSGSSIGITKVYDLDKLNEALEMAFIHDNKVVIEESINGFEVGCAVLGSKNLIVGGVDEIELTKGFFNFDEKYTLETSKIHLPARIDEDKANEVKNTAIKIYKLLSCEGMARVDMFIDKDGEIFFNEVNTIPGFTGSSRYPKMMDLAGFSYTKLIDKLIEVTLVDELSKDF